MPTIINNPSSGEQAEKKIKALASRIQNSDNIGKIFNTLVDDIKDAFDCEAVTFFAVDRAKRQLYSRNVVSDKIPEIRVDISRKSISGYVAVVGKSINITDVYSAEELEQHHPHLSFDSSWDKKLKFQTKSVLAIPLPHNKKLVGVLEIINKKNADGFTEDDFRRAKEISPALGLALAKLEMEKLGINFEVKDNLDRDEKIHNITHSIHSAKDVDEILIELKDSILEFFDAESITMYAIDSAKNEIYSKVKSGISINEIRVPISPHSIAGFVATEQKALNIANVYNSDELKKYHPSLSFDSSWDQKSGFKTRSMLVYPLNHQNKLMGVLQLINKKSDDKFDGLDEKYAHLMAGTLSLAFYNQSKFIEPKPTKLSYLLKHGLLTEEELTDSTAKSRKMSIDIETILVNDLGLKREDVGKSLEEFYKIPYYGYNSSIILPQSVFAGLNKIYLSKNCWLPVSQDAAKVVILIDDPADPEKIQNIKLIFPKRKIEFRVGLKLDIRDFLNSVLGGEKDSQSAPAKPGVEISALLNTLKAEKSDLGVIDIDREEEEDSAISDSDSTIVRLVNKIITDAYDQGISDIHIEPGIAKENVLVRYRKDGICRVYEEIPSLYKQALISRLKIMSKLDIAEKRLPQDGKIKMKYGEKEIELRVATCPTVGGNEDVVMRILAASKPLPLDAMNFSPHNLTLTKSMIVKPYGLVLVVGPTGSGKTTTLHSCLGFINDTETKIWTAEDPVEITQKGLRQVQMHDRIGLNFARAMRSFLRGDPDVIMVGEMRDAETCKIGLEAALTGHLVFSTLHTNSAPETITRLLDMGMNPLNFADALLLIVAQRLVRTLCKKCKEPYHPNREEFDTLAKEYGLEQFSELKIDYTPDLPLYKPKGCENCDNSGYAGRTGLHELLEGTSDIKRMIMKQALMEELREQAIKDGMATLKQDGILKIFKGQCDLKQILTVCMV